MTTKMATEDFLSYIKESKSKHTYKLYKIGIKKFSEWFGKSPNEILEMRRQDWISGDLFQKKRFTREIQKFHSWLRKPIHTIKGKPNQAYPINTARSYCVGILQLFGFYEMPITLPSGSDVSKTVITTKDFVPTPQQYREMYKIASDLRSKLIISMGKDLAWRIGDFVKLRKDMLPDLEQDTPILFELITEKEDVLAKSFLSQETVDLLKEYLPTLPQHNPYLFPSKNGNNHIDTDTINRILRQLAEKSKIRIPKNKRFRFHAFRKRFLSTCADLGIDVNIAKILCGKNVEQDMLTYLSEIEHRKAFLKVHDVLRLTKTPMRKTTMPTTELERKVERLEKLIHLMIGLGGRELMEKALSLLPEEERTKLFITPISDDESVEQKTAKVIQVLELIAEKQAQKVRDEYRRLIAENNNNNQ